MSHAFIQTLEDRKLFAAQPIMVTPISVMNPMLPTAPLEASAEVNVGRKNKAARPKADAPLVRATDLTGEWEGRVKVRYGFFSRKYDFDLSIIQQNDRSIIARVEVDDRDYEGIFFGRINPKNGRFRYTMDDDGEEVTIKGQLSKRGIIIGGGKVEVDYHGWDVKGSFEVDRVA